MSNTNLPTAKFIGQYPNEFEFILLSRKTKKPTHKLLDKDEIPSLGEVKRAVRNGERNLGVYLQPGQLVIDVDPRNGGDESFKRFCKDTGLQPTNFPRVRTGGGGWHLYTRVPKTFKAIPTGDRIGYPGIDFKQARGYVVGAGSVHPDTGKPYLLKDDFSFWKEPETRLPKMVMDLIKRKERDFTNAAPQNTIMGPDELDEFLDYLDPNDFPTNDEWLQLAMALHDITGGDAACGEIFDAWCSTGVGYQGDVLNRWHSFDITKADRIGFGTLKKILDDQKNAGARDNLMKARTAHQHETAAEDFDDEDDIEFERNANDDIMDYDAIREAVDAQVTDADGSVQLADLTKRTPFAVTDKGVIKSTLANYIIMVLKLDIDPRLNVLTDQVELDGKVRWNAAMGRILNDDIVNTLCVEIPVVCHTTGFEPTKDKVTQAVRYVAGRNMYNPVQEYFDGLKWDGKPRIENLFLKYAPCGGDQAYVREVGRCFMMSAVARTYLPGCKVDEMPILSGGQGLGKSTFAAILGGEFYSDTAPRDISDPSRVVEALQGVLILEHAEIASLRKSDMESFKHFMSSASERVRLAYRQNPNTFPRRSVMIGTTNETNYLMDNENRRFWPLRLKKPVRLDLLEKDRDQLWAEAVARFHEGQDRGLLKGASRCWAMDPEIWAMAADATANERWDDPWDAMLDDLIAEHEEQHDLDDVHDPGWVKATWLYERLKINSRASNDTRRIKKLMEGKGFEGPTRRRVPSGKLRFFVRNAS